jgi:DNA-binding transcriptional ArsR family regulator
MKKPNISPCCIHNDVVEYVRKNQRKEYELILASELFSVFADYTRLRIVGALLLHEMCVGDIAALLDMTHSAISHQLSVLKLAHIVTARKEGKIKYYTLCDEHIGKLFDTALEHVNE